MALGALLAGGAAGLSKGWDDNREAAKAEAQRSFQLKLENTRYENNMAGRRQENEWANERAAATARAEQEEGRIQREFDAEQNRLDRASTERAAALRAGKGGDPATKRRIDYLEQGMADAHSIIESGEDPGQVEDARKRYDAYEAEYRKLVGLDDRPAPPMPKPTQTDIRYIIGKFNSQPDVEAFIGRFGQEAFDDLRAKIDAEKAGKDSNKGAGGDQKTKDEKPRQQTFSEKYHGEQPNAAARLGRDVVNLFKKTSRAFTNQVRKEQMQKAQAAMDRTQARMEAGEEPLRQDINLLDQMSALEWVDPKAREIMEGVYAVATGAKKESTVEQ